MVRAFILLFSPRNLGAVLIQGSDTSSAALQNLLLCLVAFPEAQAKAREEIDRVVGLERAPKWDDLANLPYTMALVEEVKKLFMLVKPCCG